jgi:ribosomal 30S subunit maturation factor RimM
MLRPGPTGLLRLHRVPNCESTDTLNNTRINTFDNALPKKQAETYFIKTIELLKNEELRRTPIGQF